MNIVDTLVSITDMDILKNKLRTHYLEKSELCALAEPTYITSMDIVGPLWFMDNPVSVVEERDSCNYRAYTSPRPRESFTKMSGRGSKIPIFYSKLSVEDVVEDTSTALAVGKLLTDKLLQKEANMLHKYLSIMEKNHGLDIRICHNILSQLNIFFALRNDGKINASVCIIQGVTLYKPIVRGNTFGH